LYTADRKIEGTFHITESHKLHIRYHKLQHQGTGCNSFETAQSHNGSRLLQNSDKGVPLLNCSQFYLNKPLTILLLLQHI